MHKFLKNSLIFNLNWKNFSGMVTIRAEDKKNQASNQSYFRLLHKQSYLLQWFEENNTTAFSPSIAVCFFGEGFAYSLRGDHFGFTEGYKGAGIDDTVHPTTDCCLTVSWSQTETYSC